MFEMKVALEVTAAKTLSYTYFKTGKRPIQEITITNTGPEETAGTFVRPRVRIEAPGIPDVIKEWEGQRRELPRPQNVDPNKLTYTDLRLGINHPALGNLTDTLLAQIVVEVLDDDDNIVGSSVRDLQILSPKDWVRDDRYPDAIAAFVLPADEAVQSIIKDAREWLAQHKGSGDITVEDRGFQHTLDVAEAIYESIRNRAIHYSYEENADWDAVQRIRTPSDMLEKDLSGTCLDTTVLYAACLLEAHIRPIVFMVKRHAFAGFLNLEKIAIDRNAQNPPNLELGATYLNPQLIREAYSLGWFVPVETTSFCGGETSKNFRTACEWQSMSIETDYGNNGHFTFRTENLLSATLVRDAKKNYMSLGVIQGSSDPLVTQDGQDKYFFAHISDSEKPPTESFGAKELTPLEIDEPNQSDVPPRVRQWMSSLLDLGARNSLLRMKVGNKGMVDFSLPSEILSQIDDDLFEGKKIPIQSPSKLPKGWWDAGITMHDFSQKINEFDTPLIYPRFSSVNTISSDVESNIRFRDQQEGMISPQELASWKFLQDKTDADIENLVHKSVSERWDADLKKAMTKLQNEKTDQMLLTGNNPLFLTLGTLSWEEQPEFRNQSKTSRWEAPLYLYPIILDGGKGVPYTIRLDEHGSITPNYCLREKLLRDPINLDLPELEFPKLDDSGIDVQRNFESIEAKISENKLENFVLERQCRIGIFDYTNFLLWRDLKQDWEKMRDTSESVKHLMYTPTKPYAGEIPEVDDSLIPHCPHPVDDSQKQAISWALSGKSFRLEGPPGTGKTQTITNLIASCLAYKKKILFVAEKSTALQQVKERLYEVGLGNFCLELHAKGDSDSRIRSNILSQLSEAVGVSADPKNRQWEDLNHKAESEEQFLNKYRDSLHSKHNDYTLWELYQDLLKIGEGESITPSSHFIENFKKNWPLFREIAETLPEKIRVADGIENNPWLFVRNVDYVPLEKDQLSVTLNQLAQARKEFEGLPEELQTLHHLNSPLEISKVVAAIDLNDRGLLPTQSELSLMGGNAWEETTSELLDSVEEISTSTLHLLSVVKAEIFDRDDFKELRQLTTNVENANLLTRGKSRKLLIEKIGTDAISTDSKKISSQMSQAVSIYDLIVDLQKRFLKESGIKFNKLSIFVGKDASAETGKVVSLISSLSSGSTSEALQNVLTKLSQEIELGELQKNLLRSIDTAWQELYSKLVVTEESGVRWTAGRSLLEAWTQDQIYWAEDMERDRFLNLQRWAAVLESINQLDDCGLGILQEPILDKKISPTEMREQVERGYFQSDIKTRMSEADLDRFDRTTHENHIESLEDTQKEISLLTRDRVPGLIAGRKTKLAVEVKGAYGEQGTLMAALKPIRKSARKPIRTLVEKHGKALSDAMPCFLMSPESVATLLPVGAIEFDLVIFDEASQIRTSHAIGALGRGKTNIVVGDTKQMPPSKSFSSNDGREIEDSIEEEVEGEQSDTEISLPEGLSDLLPTPESASDTESILQEFEASQMPFMQLLCHYRSKDELLIAFSNSEIYSDNPMMTFPSVKGLNSDALKWCPTPNGLFHRKQTDTTQLDKDQEEAYKRALKLRKPNELIRTNPIEAEAVADEVWKRLNDPERRQRREEGAREGSESMIVVTFNTPQRDLIKAILLDREGDQSGVVTRAFEEKKDDESGVLVERPQLKIINLEGVQGDEAETVIFSTAFTKKGVGHANPNDPKVPGQWGPVSDPGGYRRLNVAVTRGKKEMLVFCSFDPKNLQVNDNTKYVQKFLQLAKDGPQINGDIGIEVSRNKHIADIAKEIEDKGYRVQTQVGLSSLRVDIAVGHKGQGTWEMAILVDGPNWAERGSAVQREILPKNMLKVLGWKKVKRVWLPSWLDERQRILEEIDVAMNTEVLATPTKKPAIATKSNHKEDESEATQDNNFPHFTPFDPAEYSIKVLKTSPGAYLLEHPQWGTELGKYGYEKLDETIKAVLEKEAPIEAKRLGKLVTETWGYQNRKNERQYVLNRIDPNLFENSKSGLFVWSSPTQQESFDTFRPSKEKTRNIEEIHPKEWNSALTHILEALGSLEITDAAKILSKQFGINRFTEKVENHLKSIIGEAISDNTLIANKSQISLPDND